MWTSLASSGSGLAVDIELGGLSLPTQWAYVVLALCIAGSAVFPPLPSESILVTAMGLAAADQLGLAGVCAAAFAGAVAGDLLAYAVGHALSKRLPEDAGPRRLRAALGWARARERAWGPALIVGGRFIPGGTTAVGLTSGALGYPLRSFTLLAGLGESIWTAYGVALAYIGPAVLPGGGWAPVAIAVALALAAGAVPHAVRVASARRPTQRTRSPW
jgi:membrane-associated protein